MKLSALILALLAGNALAWDDPYEYKPRMPRTSNNYDPATGNMTNTYRHADGSSDTYGNNANTGSQWRSHSDRRGNQSGTDADGNMWNFDVLPHLSFSAAACAGRKGIPPTRGPRPGPAASRCLIHYGS